MEGVFEVETGIREEGVELTSKPVIELDGKALKECTPAEVSQAIMKLLKRIGQLRRELNFEREEVRLLAADREKLLRAAKAD
jgi:hypothetical protein